MLVGLFTTRSKASSPTRGERHENRSVYTNYAPSASPGLSCSSRPLPLEVTPSVALSPAGPGRARGLSQWAIELSSPPTVVDAGKDEAKPPEPVSSNERSQAAADERMQEALAILANSARLMPWVKRIEIGPGLIFTGFVDEQGTPDLFGYIKYFGEDDNMVFNASLEAHRLHVRTHHDSSFGAADSNGRKLRHVARHDIRPVSSLPSAVTHIVQRPAAFTKRVLAVYIGEIRKGRRHGFGRIKFHSGREYAGQWDQDQAQGVGVEKKPDNSRYYGHVARWRSHGYGLLINGSKEGRGGYPTKEGLFTDGRVDLCAVSGRLQPDCFQVTRDAFVWMHFDCIISSEAFDPCVRQGEHIDLVKEADSAFQKALEAERGANVMVNLVLHLDETCTQITRSGEGASNAHADLVKAHNFCSRSFEESSLLKTVWVDTIAAGAYTELEYGFLLSLLRRGAGNFFDTHAPRSLSNFEGSHASIWPTCNDLPSPNSGSDLRLHLYLRENFETMSSTRALLIAFERQLCREIATAIGIPLDRLTILATGPSGASVVVLLLVIADALGPTAAEIGQRLAAQVSCAGSSLRNGLHTRKIFRCESGEKRAGKSEHPHTKGHLLHICRFPWHSDDISTMDNEVQIVSKLRRQLCDRDHASLRPTGSTASHVPSKYEFRPRSAFGRSIGSSAISELDSPPKSMINLSPRKSVKIAEDDPSEDCLKTQDIHIEQETWAEKARKRLSPPATISQASSQEEASLLLNIEQKRQALRRIMAGGRYVKEPESSKTAYNPVSPLQSPHPRPGNRREDQRMEILDLEGMNRQHCGGPNGGDSEAGRRMHRIDRHAIIDKCCHACILELKAFGAIDMVMCVAARRAYQAHLLVDGTRPHLKRLMHKAQRARFMWRQGLVQESLSKSASKPSSGRKMGWCRSWRGKACYEILPEDDSRQLRAMDTIVQDSMSDYLDDSPVA